MVHVLELSLELVVVSLHVDADVLSHLHALLDAFVGDVVVIFVLAELVFDSFLEYVLLLYQLGLQSSLAHVQSLLGVVLKLCEFLLHFLFAFDEVADDRLQLVRAFAGRTDSCFNELSDFNLFLIFLNQICAFDYTEANHLLHKFELVLDSSDVGLPLFLHLVELLLELPSPKVSILQLAIGLFAALPQLLDFFFKVELRF